MTKYGKVTCVKIKEDRKGRPSYSAFVCYQNKEDATASIQNIQMEFERGGWWKADEAYSRKKSHIGLAKNGKQTVEQRTTRNR